MSARTFWAFLGVLAVVGLLGYGLIAKNPNSIAIGQAMPDRDLVQLETDVPGRIADYRGQWVLVNLWASWCPPCLGESPALETFYRSERAHNFTVLGIDSKEVSDSGAAFVRENHITYPQLYDGPGDLSDDLGTRGFPESFLVNPQGKVALVRRGAVNAEYLNTVVRPIVEGRSPS